MAVPIEAYTVVAQKERVIDLIESGQLQAPNHRGLADDHLWCCSFMAHSDALALVSRLDALGVNTAQGPDSDIVVVNEFDQSIDPYCEWLQMGQWDKAWIAWLVGTEPKTVVAREGWDPSVGSGLSFSDGSDLEFVRMDENVEVHRNKETGEEVYIGRTEIPVEVLYEHASKVIIANMRTAGEPPLQSKSLQQVTQAVEEMSRVCEHPGATWQAWWLLGKGQIAIAQYEKAYQSFSNAYAKEQNHTAIPREWGGVCLELQRFDEAVGINRLAVAIEPDSNELVANLAISMLFAGQLDLADRTIEAALKLSPKDPVNQNIRGLITETQEGRRPQPRSFKDLSKPAKPKKKAWMFWK
ncbi:MAG: tetratricopeptide repeat protein [Planctomycetota bacterium]